VSLIIQLLGCIGAAGLIAVLVHGDTRRRTVAASAAALGVVVVALFGMQGLWSTAQQQRALAKGQRQLTEAQANTAGGRAIGVNADFVEWVTTQTGAKDTWYLVPQDGTVIQWLSYRMLPRLTVDQPRKGTWLVFYNTTPHKAGYRRAQLSDVRRYQPGFEIARFAGPGGAT
jgi:hypothetical protein